MSKEKKARAKRKPTFLESIIPIIAMLLILTIGKGVLGYSTEPLLILVACVSAFVAYRVGITWDEMLEEISNKIAKGMPAILILVTVGAMVGNLAMTVGLPGFALDFGKVIDKMKSTAQYIGEYDIHSRLVQRSVLTPSQMTVTIDIPVFPICLGCKQWNTPYYQARPLYKLYSNERSLKVTLSRDYLSDREAVTIDEVMNEQGESLSLDTVQIVQQSLVEDGKHWLDKGSFTLTIN